MAFSLTWPHCIHGQWRRSLWRCIEVRSLGENGFLSLHVCSRAQSIETIMLMTLSHWVVLKTFLVCGLISSTNVSGLTSSTVEVSFARFFAMMARASTKAFSCSSRACFVFTAIALPVAIRFGFFLLVIGIFEVTCWSAGCVSASTIRSTDIFSEQIYLIEELISKADQLFWSFWGLLGFNLLSAEIDMFCGDQRHVGENKQPPTSHPKPACQGRQLFCDDVIVL